MSPVNKLNRVTLPSLEPAANAGDAFVGITDLIKEFKFSPKDGRIWLGDARMLLVHSEALCSLRAHMAAIIGDNQTRRLLTRVGFSQGILDARLARRVRHNQSHLDAFKVGPQLHSLEGVVHVEEVHTEMDVSSGWFYGEYLWHDSTEALDHVNRHGASTSPVCWTQIGYSSGYTTTFIGQPILFREVECRAMGFDHCRIIGKPLHEWDDIDEIEQDYFNPEPFESVSNSRPVNNQSSPSEHGNSHPLIGISPGFKKAKNTLSQVAETDSPVLLIGESGVGKEVFARNLHRMSGRRNQPFVAVNCAAIPEELIEAELFGVCKGAFTGATRDRPGRFERANGGVLFLDEVSSLSLAAQGKLLRALQDFQIERVGAIAPRQVNVRVVAASNSNLADDIQSGRFRHDLYYRLNVIPIVIPPLRERREDISLLANRVYDTLCSRYQKQLAGFSPGAIEALESHPWPGNIRELENLVERGVVLTPHGQPINKEQLFCCPDPLAELILSQHQPAETIQPPMESLLDNLKSSGLSLDQIESQLLTDAVSDASGNLSQAARTLGITRAQLAYRLEKHKKA